jgi:hypothetical protein
MELYSNVSEGLSASIIREWRDGCPLCVTYVYAPSSTAPGQRGLRTGPTWDLSESLRPVLPSLCRLAKPFTLAFLSGSAPAECCSTFLAVRSAGGWGGLMPHSAPTFNETIFVGKKKRKCEHGGRLLFKINILLCGINSRSVTLTKN